MHYLLATIRRRYSHRYSLLVRHYKPQKPPKPPAPPSPPKPPKKVQAFTFHDHTWEDPYSWMSSLNDKVAMRHMDVHMEQEEKYTEAVLSDTERLQSKLQSEMAFRLASELSTPPLRWGPWLYYRRVEEGKQYPVLCRRLAKLNEEFISYKSPAAGFDFTSGKKIEQKLLDLNQEAERFGGYAYEELSEVSPDHRFLAYTMYDKDNDYFVLSVRNLNSGSLCRKPQAVRVSNIAWAKDGQMLLYVVTDNNKRPYRIYCSIIGSTDEDVLLVEEPNENVYVNIRHTKDFQFVTVNTFSTSSSKVFLINAADPLAGMTLVWECEGLAHCIVEHHQGYLYLFTDAAKDGQVVDYHYLLHSPVEASASPRIWETVFDDDQDLVVEDVDFCSTHLAIIIREGRKFRLCSVALPLPVGQGTVHLKELHPHFLPLPKYVSQIAPGPNYDYYSLTMRFTLSSPVMPDAVVDYDLSNGKWNIIQQQNVLHERTRILYGTASSASVIEKSMKESSSSVNEVKYEDNLWNDLSEFYACEHYDVSSYDGTLIPLTIVYSRKHGKENQNPGLLHGHGAYGELLDKRWRSELKSLLDRGWVIAYADVRGGGGGGKTWHHDGRRTKKENSIKDFISCAKFLIQEEIVQENKLAGWGYSAGGLLVASAINYQPDLFRAAVLKVPFLDATNTLLYPIIPLTAADYEEFGYPGDIDDFHAIRNYSPYDNIQKDVLYPAVLVTSSFNTRFGVWEAAKWVARVRDSAIYDPKRPILLNLTIDIVEDNRYLRCKEAALETAFLIKMMEA
ncbi:dipeptidyl aminopeptidase BI isoform X2 [Mangifera indica]|uniref:dipeptidyl aminopeptidase BI isoform X2 n=1 Tax=Mangifera indica TaxID=29780 RepID=UPI001CFAE3B8|nr:dipeptidyl aminopeptidase BI isoform X2 [Mangifera indica]